MTYAPNTSLAKRDEAQTEAVALLTKQSETLLNLITASTEPIASSPLEIALRIDSSKTLLLSQHRRENADHLKATLTLLLLDVFEFYGVEEGRSMRAIQLVLPHILKDYWHLTAEDVQLFAREAMRGAYGKVYGQLTPAVLMQWIDEYAIRRDDAIVGGNIQAHQQYKERADNLSEAYASQELDKLLRGTMERKTKPHETPEVKPQHVPHLSASLERGASVWKPLNPQR